MPLSPARQLAYKVLLRLESASGFAVDLLQGPEVSALKDTDRRLATEIVMGVMRWRGELDFQIARLSGKGTRGLDPEVLTVLRMGAYQISFLARTPKRAVVDDAVELTKGARKRSAAGFVNAVLRKFEPSPDRVANRDFDQLSQGDWDSVQRAFPAWLIERWEAWTATTTDSGKVEALRLAYAFLHNPHTTLRGVDPAADVASLQRELATQGVVTAPCEYAEAHGLVVESGHIQHTRLYREGRVVIQDEASQLVAELVHPAPGMRVLDLCAAPGIKSGQLAQALGSGTLVACDYSAARLETMAKLLPKWIPPGVRVAVVRLDAAAPLPFAMKFDRILLDAPCSGTGTLGRNPEIKWRLRPGDISRLAGIQAAMLRNAAPWLAPDGRLVYATCSLEPEENAGVIESVLDEMRDFRVLTSQELASEHPRLVPLFDARGYFSTRPDQHSMDGFNAAVLVRKGRGM